MFGKLKTLQRGRLELEKMNSSQQSEIIKVVQNDEEKLPNKFRSAKKLLKVPSITIDAELESSHCTKP